LSSTSLSSLPFGFPCLDGVQCELIGVCEIPCSRLMRRCLLCRAGMPPSETSSFSPPSSYQVQSDLAFFWLFYWIAACLDTPSSEMFFCFLMLVLHRDRDRMAVDFQS